MAAAVYDGNKLGPCNVTLSATRVMEKRELAAIAVGANAETGECKALSPRWKK